MPELPEVETVRAGIVDHSLGRPVRAVRVVDARSLRRHLPGPAHFEAALTGRALRGAYRRGKYLWLTLSEAGRHACRRGARGASGHERSAARAR